MTPNTKAEKARRKILDLLAIGWTDEALLIDTAAQEIGGDEQAQIIVAMVWRKHFEIKGPN